MNVAVITGAASGIGWALSLVYLQKNATVVLVDKNKSKLASVTSEFEAQFPNKVLALTCDLSREEEVLELASTVQKELGRVDWLFNNAGIIGSLGPVWELETKEVQQVMEVNLYGMLHMIRAFTPLLFKQPFCSHVINIASLYALCSGSQMAAYAMSKHAVLALSESLYFDLCRLEKPVQVSVAFPSFTDTSLLSHSDSASTSFQSSLQSLLAHSRPALEVAQHIAQEVEHKRFYIFPDREVKSYCEERTKSIVLQEQPHKNNIEKLVNSLLKRQESIE